MLTPSAPRLAPWSAQARHSGRIGPRCRTLRLCDGRPLEGRGRFVIPFGAVCYPFCISAYQRVYQRVAAFMVYARVGGGLLSLLGQFVIPFVSARISYVSATYQLCISVDAFSRS